MVKLARVQCQGYIIMTTEFVEIDNNGKEIDWIEPVESSNETETHWIIDNGYNIYDIEKKEGYTYIFRNYIY